MRCVICSDYRQFVHSNGNKPFSFSNAGEPGFMQPPADLVDRHRDNGCEPVYEDEEWQTACDHWISQEVQMRESAMIQKIVTEVALKSWVQEHGREPDPLSEDVLEEYLGEWLTMMREADSEYLADQVQEAA